MLNLLRFCSDRPPLIAMGEHDLDHGRVRTPCAGRRVSRLGVIAVTAATFLISQSSSQAETSASMFDYSENLKARLFALVAPGAPPIAVQIANSAGLRPYLFGRADLPDGAIIQIQLKKPWLPDGQQRINRGLSACEKNCMPPGEPLHPFEGAQVEIRNKAFRTEPLSFGEAPLIAGIYKLSVILETGDFSAPFKEIYQGQIVVRN